jgi:hypothetical protein
MRKAVLIGIAGAAIASAGCGQTRVEDGGPTVQRNYQVGAFERIEVAGPYEVEVRTGADPSVSASGPERLMERLVVEVRGDRLVIHSRNERRWWSGWRGRGTARVQVTAPSIRAASLAGSGGISLDQVSGASFEGSVAGSGDLRVDSVEVESLKLSVAGSGDVRARSGQARRAEYGVAGSGDIDARGVRSETVAVSVAGSGDIRAEATGTADVSIMGSGDVELTGGARCNVSKAGSGEVRCS